MDHVVLSEDPGAHPMIAASGKSSGKLNNVNRQLTSTLAGLLQASRPIALKIRSDMALESNQILALDRTIHEEQCSFFKQKIVVNGRGTMDPRIGPVSHPGDFVLLGLREDMIRLFSRPLVADEPLDHARRSGGQRMAVAWGRLLRDGLQRDSARKWRSGNRLWLISVPPHAISSTTQKKR